MKRVLFALGLALLLTACGTSKEVMVAHYEAVKSANELEMKREERLMEQEARADAAVVQLASDDASRATTQNYFMMKGMASVLSKAVTSGKPSAAASYQLPANESLMWVTALSAPATSIINGLVNYKLGSRQSDNNLAATVSTNNMWGGVMNTGFNTIGSVANAGINKPVFSTPIPTAEVTP